MVLGVLILFLSVPLRLIVCTLDIAKDKLFELNAFLLDCELEEKSDSVLFDPYFPEIPDTVVFRDGKAIEYYSKQE